MYSYICIVDYICFTMCYLSNLSRDLKKHMEILREYIPIILLIYIISYTYNIHILHLLLHIFHIFFFFSLSLMFPLSPLTAVHLICCLVHLCICAEDNTRQSNKQTGKGTVETHTYTGDTHTIRTNKEY